MKSTKLKFTKGGKAFEGTVLLPENLVEMRGLHLADADYLRCFLVGYLEDAKKAIMGVKRKKKQVKLTFNVELLTEEKLAELLRLALPKGEKA